MQSSISKDKAGSWDIQSEVDGETVVLHRGLSNADAKVALYRMMYGLPPVDGALVVAEPAAAHELSLAA